MLLLGWKIMIYMKILRGELNCYYNLGGRYAPKFWGAELCEMDPFHLGLELQSKQ